MIYFAAYIVFLALFLVGNYRWSKRMEAYDAAMEQGLKSQRSRVFRDN